MDGRTSCDFDYPSTVLLVRTGARPAHVHVLYSIWDRGQVVGGDRIMDIGTLHLSK